MAMATIEFRFEDKNLETKTFPIAAGESVLDIAMDEDIGLHHNCGGVCGCSTCHIYVVEGGDNFQEISDREEDFIDRAISPKINSRLACQCVLEDDTNVVVVVPDQSVLIGH
jgi:2Fe-2S ferredoxin